MESESDNAATKGRPTRRNKIVHQTERDKNQENIDDSLKDNNGTSPEESSMVEDPTLKITTTRVEDKQASSTPNNVNSSTPRRKKDPLANLHSNLSPKYIGFVTPTSNLDNSREEQTRKTRRRHNLSSNTSAEKDTSEFGDDDMAGQLFGVHETSVVGYVRRIPKETNDSPDRKNGRRKEFVSPIDKLLKKNGSIVDSDKLPEVDGKIVNSESNVTDGILSVQLDCENESERFFTYEIDDDTQADERGNGHEGIESNEVVNNTKMDSQVYGKEEMNANSGRESPVTHPENMSTAGRTEDIPKNDENVYSPDSEDNVGTTDKDNEQCDAESPVESEYSNKAEVDASIRNELSHTKDENANEKLLTFKLPDNVHPPKENNEHIEQNYHTESQSNSTPEFSDIFDQKSEEKHDLDTVETDSNTEFVVDTASAKSPSAISMDSAKGSSIINEGSWMNFSTGDLFWGQIYNYCYWPCMVCPDPEGKSITTKENNLSGDQHVMVHVRFFADNARRNWVKRENLMPFTTLEQYQERLEDCREKHGSKSAKFKMFVPKKKQVSLWYEAINEANIVANVPYEERLEKFYEVFDKSKTSQKNKQQRRKSMYIPAARQVPPSDAESLYGSHENVNNLSVPSTANKRERSTSPFSPAYSPVKNITLKKRKLSEDVELPTTSVRAQTPVGVNSRTTATTSSHTEENQPYTMDTSSSSQRKSLDDLNIFNGMEFQKLYSVMKDYVLEGNTDEILDKSLVVAVRNIWGLKQLSRQQMQQKLSLSTTEIEMNINDGGGGESRGGVKRLSNRLRNIMMRKSFLSQRSSLDLSSDVPITQKQIKDAATNVEKPKKQVNRPILEVIDDIFELDSKYLFKGMVRDPVCKYCCKPGGNIRKCAKNCHNWLHPECLMIDFSQNGKIKKSQKRALAALKSVNDSSLETSKSNSSSTADLLAIEPATSSELSTIAPHVTSETETEVICRECTNKEPAKCMVCNLTDSGRLEDPLVKCTMGQCDRAFHPACCKYWPQSKITISKNHIQSFRCPSHVCHTCVSDDPKGKFQQLSNAKITKCIKCPASYHTDSTCIPAGSQILTAAHIICPRHASLKHDMTINVNWCFICVRGGQVVCCETCPTAVHAQCLKIPIDPNEGYICEECESGRMPLYGEMVWAKFTNFRWWPAIILPPTEIPQNIAKKTHNPSDFVVRFFGTHDHGWISRRRVYLYLEGDSSEPPKSKTSALDQNYNRGIEEAKMVYEIVKAKKLQQRTLNENKEKLHPQPYVRIKANRAVAPVKLHVDIESVSKCDCDPNDENPCGPETNCLNRVLYHECNPKVCPARERCQNQMFESRVSPRLDVVYMKERGFGLITRESIKAGSFVIEYVGEIINDDEFRARMAQKSLDRDENFYFLSVEKDYIIDAGPKGNLARFMNHSCDPNCETQKWSVNSLNRVGLFAIKDIPENTELTFNYHWDDLLGNEKKTCYCSSKKCSGQIGGKLKDSDSKEPTPISDGIGTKTTKGKTKKSKLKPLKRLHTKAAISKRKPPMSKLKVNAAKHKSNKMAAASAVAASLNIVPELNSPKKDENRNDNKEIISNSSPTPEDVLC